MTRQRLAMILVAAIGGLFLAGCECNKSQFYTIYGNLSGADWRETVRDCRCDNEKTDLSGLDSNLSGADWRKTVRECRCDNEKTDLSGLDSNLSGADWRDYVAGNCGTPPRYASPCGASSAARP